MKKRTARKIFFTIAVLFAPPAFFLLNIARYLALDAVIVYSAVVLFFSLILWLLENRYSSIAVSAQRNILFAAFHAIAAVALCYVYGVDSWAGMGVFPVLAIFFMWLFVKILFVYEKTRQSSRSVIIVFGGIAAMMTVWFLFPDPLNYLPIPVLILAFPIRVLMKKFFPKQRIATTLAAYLFFIVLVILVLNFTTVRHGRTANFLVMLVFLFELLFTLKAHHALRKIFLPTVLFLDMSILITMVCFPAGKYFTVLTGLVVVAFTVGASTLRGLGLHIATRNIIVSNYVGLFAGVIAIGAILFSRIVPCDYGSVEKDFKIISRSEGSYDMVLSPDGRYLYAVFGDPVHTLEKIDISGVDENVVYHFEEETAEPERLVLDDRRGRVAVSVWGEPNMKLAVFDSETLELISISGGESLPHNPDNIKADREFNYYYVLGERIGEVAKVNAETLETEKFGRSHLGIAYGMCLDEDRGLLYTSSWIGPFITTFDLETLKVKYRFRAELVNAEINCDPKTGRVYAGNFLKKHISIYDIKKGEKKIDKIPDSFGARDLAIDADRRIIMSGAYFSGVLEGIDMESGKRLFRYKPGKYVRGIEYDKKSGRLFVACRCGIFELKKNISQISDGKK